MLTFLPSPRTLRALELVRGGGMDERRERGVRCVGGEEDSGSLRGMCPYLDVSVLVVPLWANPAAGGGGWEGGGGEGGMGGWAAVLSVCIDLVACAVLADRWIDGWRVQTFCLLRC